MDGQIMTARTGNNGNTGSTTDRPAAHAQAPVQRSSRHTGQPVARHSTRPAAAASTAATSPLGAHAAPAPASTLPSLPSAPSITGGLRPRGWLTRNWRVMRPVWMQRVGVFLQQVRVDGHHTQRDLSDQAIADGERLSQAAVNDAEMLRFLRPDGTSQTGEYVRGPSFANVLYRLYNAGYTLADLEDFLKSGDMRVYEPTARSRAQAVHAAFLTLAPENQLQLERFTATLMEMEARVASAMMPVEQQQQEQALDASHALLAAQLDAWELERDQSGGNRRRPSNG